MPISKPLAVVDIGSNSVRLVIYDGLKRSPMAIFNEKVLCGLAKDMEKTGCLYKPGVKMAHDAIRRFIKLADVMESKSIKLFATSAVRDADDGHEFVANLENEFGIAIDIFSGEDEAKYAALGVIASINKTDGLVGDLGGGSLELVGLENSEVDEKRDSYPIGPLRAPNIKGRLQTKKFIDKYIEQFPLREKLEDKSFYAVGGAFRNLAKVHMARKNYPLKVIHNYKVPASDFLNTLQIVTRMSAESLKKLQGIPSKRRSFLPYAATLLEEILIAGKAKSVVFSAAGVREGYIYSKIANDIKKQDALIAGCSEIMARMRRTPEYGYELADWMSPLFEGETKYEARLRLATCIMSEISCYENTEYKAELAYRKILDSSLTGLNHKDRVFIAKALYCRYSSTPDEYILSTMQPLLSSKKIQDAQVIGSAMRLGRSLSCSNAGVLQNTQLILSKKKLTLKINEGSEALKGESLTKRMAQLAEVMGLKPEIL